VTKASLSGADATARLMRDNGPRGRHKRRFKRTTDSEHNWPIAPNLLDQDFAATRPNEKWGADISFVWTREGWLYLAVVVDLFSRRIIGGSVNDRLHRGLALAAIRRPTPGLICHSDRGSYRQLHRQLLQPRTATFVTGLCQPGRIREARRLIKTCATRF
jgi:putative transposase